MPCPGLKYNSDIYNDNNVPCLPFKKRLDFRSHHTNSGVTDSSDQLRMPSHRYQYTASILTHKKSANAQASDC